MVVVRLSENGASPAFHAFFVHHASLSKGCPWKKSLEQFEAMPGEGISWKGWCLDVKNQLKSLYIANYVILCVYTAMAI